MSDLLLQQVGFVEEENDGGVLEPGVGQDGLEQGQTLDQPILQKRTGHTCEWQRARQAGIQNAAPPPLLSSRRFRSRRGPGRTR